MYYNQIHKIVQRLAKLARLTHLLLIVGNEEKKKISQHCSKLLTSNSPLRLRKTKSFTAATKSLSASHRMPSAPEELKLKLQ